MNNIIELLKIILPSVVAVVSVWITYNLGLRRFQYEEKNKADKKIREILSNILLIWHEFTIIKEFLENKAPAAKLIYKTPELAKDYLNIDKNKIKKFQDSYNIAIEHVKEIDIALYFRLESALNPFTRVIDDILNPILEDEKSSLENKKDILIPLISDNVKDLKEIIDIIKLKLSYNDQKEVDEIIKDTSEDSPREIPDFLEWVINKGFRPKEPITKDEITLILQNETCVWVISKFLETPFVKIIDYKKPFEVIKLLSISGTKTGLENINITEADIFLSLTLTQEEEDHYIKNNRNFYLLLLEIVRKLTGQIPNYSLKRELIKLNNGYYNLTVELEEKKKTYLTENNQS